LTDMNTNTAAPQFGKQDRHARRAGPRAWAELARPSLLTNACSICCIGPCDLLAQARRSARAGGCGELGRISACAEQGRGAADQQRSRSPRRVLAALAVGVAVTIFAETVPLPALEIVRPDVYVKGGDYDMAHVPEAQLARTWGARTVAIAFAHDRSTTALVQRLRAAK